MSLSSLPVEGLGLQGTFPTDWAYLCCARPGAHPHVDQIVAPSKPLCPGTVDEFLAAHGKDPALVRQMKNKVRKCACGKSVAYTLSSCNLCGASLAAVSISYTDNVFTGFIYGIEKTVFPLTISLRYQSEKFMVFDDLLALSPCHLNVIPTTAYIPDWRFLLKRPSEGLALIREMHRLCQAVAREQFCANEAFRAKVWGSLSAEEVVASVCAGFNIPPSQYQLHLQFIVPPLLPYQDLMYHRGNHYTKGRFFPYEFVCAVLAANSPMDVTDDTPLDAVLEHCRSCGVHYDEMHARFYRRVAEMQAKTGHWRPEDFEGFGVGDKVFVFAAPGAAGPAFELAVQRDAKAVQAADKLALQNYGRPYTAETQKPTGTFYSFPKQPADVAAW